ncbi:hypothetical protein [Moraxella lacunata]|uniref:hypothetical protein n=1 Tax=Moraxella lacunata TaxID=477 RepID=UPI003EE344E7
MKNGRFPLFFIANTKGRHALKNSNEIKLFYHKIKIPQHFLLGYLCHFGKLHLGLLSCCQ